MLGRYKKMQADGGKAHRVDDVQCTEPILLRENPPKLSNEDLFNILVEYRIKILKQLDVLAVRHFKKGDSALHSFILWS